MPEASLSTKVVCALRTDIVLFWITGVETATVCGVVISVEVTLPVLPMVPASTSAWVTV